MARTQFRSYPKRRIEKVVSTVFHVSEVGANRTVLHVCEDSKTLVRAIVTGEACHQGGVAAQLQCQLAVDPAGQAVVNPVPAQALDADMASQELIRLDKYSSHDGTFHSLAFDSKGQRKLKPGDQLVLTDISSLNLNWSICVTVVLIFKE